MAKKTNKKAKFDMYDAVTKRILEQLEQGKIPWLKPWTGGAAGILLAALLLTYGNIIMEALFAALGL